MANGDAGQDARIWSRTLGLAASPLFGSQQDDAAHYAFFDGRLASFACSMMKNTVSPADSRNWQWSADLSHHVLVTETEVQVRSGQEAQFRKFDRHTVESQLPLFLEYLERRKPHALPDIIPYLLEEFTHIWAALPPEAGGHAALAALIISVQAADNPRPDIFIDSDWRLGQAKLLELSDDVLEVLADLPQTALRRASTLQERSPSGLRIIPELVLRHAAGRLFQEAHAFLERGPVDLFGESSAVRVPRYSPSGAYFTPVALARLLTESALAEWHELPSELVIADLACGSGVFLTEALHELERRQFTGCVTLIGRDVSPEAITMARAWVAATKLGITRMTVRVDIAVASLIEGRGLPAADVVLMNPPFRSWEQMSDVERNWVRSLGHGLQSGRPDMSVGFIEQSLSSVKEGGVLATLVPSGVLSSDGLRAWRASILPRATPRLIAVLGEHGLFRHATVNIGALVLHKGIAETPGDKELDVAWSGPVSGAASSLMRATRRRITSRFESPPFEGDAKSWSIFTTTLDSWKARHTWLPGPGAIAPALELVRHTVTTRVDDLFSVRQGIRTGANEFFVHTDQEVQWLPKSERSYFVPVVENDSFVEGELRPKRFLFVPDVGWTREAQVKEAVPQIYKTFLLPGRVRLMSRSGIRYWWAPTRGRRWSFNGIPRLVSKRFGLAPAFGRDFAAEYAIMQANAWIPNKQLGGDDTLLLHEVLTGYWWLLNSRVADVLFREYCPNVAGGQLDLEHKYVRHVPMPNLLHDIKENLFLGKLASEMRMKHGEGLPSIRERDQYAAAAYRVPLTEWQLPA